MLANILLLNIPILVGDFNVITDRTKKKEGKEFLLNRDIWNFWGFLSINDPVDLGFSCLLFTWCDNRQERTRF